MEAFISCAILPNLNKVWVTAISQLTPTIHHGTNQLRCSPTVQCWGLVKMTPEGGEAMKEVGSEPEKPEDGALALAADATVSVLKPSNACFREEKESILADSCPEKVIRHTASYQVTA